MTQDELEVSEYACVLPTLVLFSLFLFSQALSAL